MIKAHKRLEKINTIKYEQYAMKQKFDTPAKINEPMSACIVQAG